MELEGSEKDIWICLGTGKCLYDGTWMELIATANGPVSQLGRIWDGTWVGPFV